MDKQTLVVLLDAFLPMENMGIKFHVLYEPVKEVERLYELHSLVSKHDRYQEKEITR